MWWVTVQSATECTPRLLQMFPIAIEYLEYGTETLRKVLKIIESYAILAPDLVLSQYALPLFTSLTGLIGDLKPEATNTIIHLLDTILLASPIHLYAEALINSNLLWRMLNIIMENKVWRLQTTFGLKICQLTLLDRNTRSFSPNICRSLHALPFSISLSFLNSLRSLANNSTHLNQDY